jgi:chromosome segregation ATPase
MNVLSYENYCLKVKLQELLEKMANIQNGKPSSPTSSPMRDEQLENEYKEIINKKELEIEYLKDMIATLKEESTTINEPPQDDKIATYEAAISALQEQHKLLHENIQSHEATIATYQEQHKLLREAAENHKNAISEYQEQHKLLHEAVENHKSTLTNLEQQYNLLHQTHTKTHDELTSKNAELEALQNAMNEEREQFKAIIIGKDAEISIYKK